MPDGVLEKLKTRNIDLNLLLRVARESNYEPQEIFHEEFQDSEHLKSYRVWIE